MNTHTHTHSTADITLTVSFLSLEVFGEEEDQHLLMELYKDDIFHIKKNNPMSFALFFILPKTET